VAQVHGQWLRQQCQDRGWNVPQMARRLREAATSANDTLPGKSCLTVMIHRWEDNRSGISERYRLHYCKAFQIPAARFGDPAALTAPHADDSGRRKTGHAGGEQPEAIMTRLCWQSLSGTPDQPAPQPAFLRDQMQGALGELAGPAKRDQLCFLLGYACAVLATAAPANRDTPPVAAGSGDAGST